MIGFNGVDMVAIFLDIDGVLNTARSKAEIGTNKGIDDNKVLLLKRLVEVTRASLILISSWKELWFKEPYLKDQQDGLANYLDDKLKRQCLLIQDKIDEGLRAEEIKRYIDKYGLQSYVILDDEDEDYGEYGLLSHLVKIDRRYGLRQSDLLQAIGRLN